jgi:hypothetical protein
LIADCLVTEGFGCWVFFGLLTWAARFERWIGWNLASEQAVAEPGLGRGFCEERRDFVLLGCGSYMGDCFVGWLRRFPLILLLSGIARSRPHYQTETLSTNWTRIKASLLFEQVHIENFGH